MTGRMAEWSNAAVLKTAEPVTVPGFESSPSAILSLSNFTFRLKGHHYLPSLAYASGLSHQGKYRID